MEGNMEVALVLEVQLLLVIAAHSIADHLMSLLPQARSRGLPLRVSGISPGLVETEFFAVRAFGDASQAQQVGTITSPC
jgi:NADP-dependent 3-hydroxy acid dehydrogenase YdfG